MSETPNAAVRRIRQERGMTMQQMASACGISAPCISRIENGLRVTGDQAIALARWTGEPVETFYDSDRTTREAV